jgi:hypothetical protein
MVCPIISNLIAAKVQCGECLYAETKINMKQMIIGCELPCYLLRHERDLLPKNI